MTSVLLTTLIFTCIYGVMAISLDILLGETGIFSVAHAVFFGVGSYAAGFMLIHVSDSMLLGIVTAVACAALVGAGFALTAVRSHEITFVVASLALSVIFSQALSSWASVTGGQGGLSGIVGAQIFGLVVATPGQWAVFSVVVVVLVLLCRWAIARSALGLRFRIIRENELASSTMGQRIVLDKFIAVVISAALASIGGALYAYYVQFISPASFTVDLSILVAAMVIIGGIGRVLGPFLGAILLTAMPQVLNLLPIPASQVGPTTQILYGAAIVLIMLVEPGGVQALCERAAAWTLRFRGDRFGLSRKTVEVSQ